MRTCLEVSIFGMLLLRQGWGLNKKDLELKTHFNWGGINEGLINMGVALSAKYCSLGVVILTNLNG